MDLVVHQVVQLEHVDIAHGDTAIEGIAGAAIEQLDLAGGFQPGQCQHVRHVGFLACIGPYTVCTTSLRPHTLGA